MKQVKNSFYLLVLFTFIIFSSCEEDLIDIGVPNICAENPEFNFNSVSLTMQTEITSERTVSVTVGGIIRGDSIAIKQGDFEKLAFINGIICKDLTTSIDVKYRDTTDKSGLKITTRDSLSYIAGKIYYCPDINNCDYMEIGRVMGWITGAFNGFFYSPLVNGSFRILPNYTGRIK